jgi:hypothetical protein
VTRRRYVWRVTARFRQEQPPAEWTAVRHYHSEAAARHRAAVLLGAVEPVNTERFGWLPRAESVVIERSAPVDGWTVVSS